MKDSFEELEGLWVFVSHSTKDFEQVRLVRNALEESGFRPILFYLKSITDENEINDLLKREIDARKRFILCDSPNARESKYVKSEVEYIRSKRRMYEVIDLSQIRVGEYEKDSVLSLIQPFRIRSHVFMSSTRSDKCLASILEQGLKTEGFNVENSDTAFDFAIMNIPGGSAEYSSSVDYVASQIIHSIIIDTLSKGYLLCLINNETVHSRYQLSEIRVGLKHNPSQLFPVITDNVDIKLLPNELSHLQILNVSGLNTCDEKAKAIIEALISHDLDIHQ